MLQGKKLGFIGGGNMAEAILSGALEAGALVAEKIWVSDVSSARLEGLKQRYGVQTVPNDEQNTGAKRLAASCDVLVLAIKPQLAADILPGLGASLAPAQTIISIIGGTTLASLEGWLPNSPVVRVMPNTPMLVRKGTAAICPGSRAKEGDVALCRALFDAVGDSLMLSEKLLNAFTAVSGCGPAFAYLFMEALADGGVEQGLPREVAQQAAAQMLAGAAEMVLQTGRHPAALKDSVCSPGGGTIAGVHALAAGGFGAAVMEAVDKSRRRMDELG